MALITTTERNELISLFVSMFNGAPGADNLTDMVVAYEGGASLADIAATLAAKPEFLTVYPGFLTSEEFADRMISNMLTAATPDSKKVNVKAYLLGELNAGASRASLFAFAVKALGATTKTEYADAQAAMTNKTAVAKYYSVDKEQSSANLADLQAVISGVTSDAATVTTATGVIDGDVAAATGQTFNLTTGVDTVTGTAGNDVINGVAQLDSTLQNAVQTFSALDTIDGGAGNDLLMVVDDQNNIATPATATVKNVEAVQFKAGAKLTADTSKWTGLSSITVDVAGNDTDLTAGKDTSLSVGDITGTLTVKGGSTLAMTGSVDTTKAIALKTNNTLTSASVKGGSTVIVDKDKGDGLGTKDTSLATLNVDGNTDDITVVSDAISTLGLANLATAGKKATITNANAAGHTLTVNASKAGTKGTFDIIDKTATALTVATSGGASDLSFTTADAAKTLTVSGDQVLTVSGFTQTTATTLTTLTVTDKAGVKGDFTGSTGLKTVNLGGTEGTNTLTLGNVASLAVTGGTGKDSVETKGAIDAKSTVSLGAGDDTYKFDTAATTGAKVTGGDGSDTLHVVNGTTLLNAAAADVYSGFEVLEIGTGQGTYDMSLLSLSAVTLTGAVLAGAADITKAAAGTTLKLDSNKKGDLITGNALSIALKDASGTTDAVTLDLIATDSSSKDGTADGKWTVTKFEVKDDTNGKGVETVTVTSTVTSPDVDDATTPAKDESLKATAYVNTITDLTAAKATLINLAGSAGLAITTLNAGAATKIVATGGQLNITNIPAATALTIIDAQAVTGTVTVGAAVTGNTAGITFLGGSGVDTYTASAKGDLLVGNGGADVFTLGGGKDTVRYANATHSTMTLDTTKNTIKGNDVVTGFTSGTDKIELSSALGLATGDARTAITLKTAAAGATAANLNTAIGNGTDFFNDGAVDRAVATMSDGADLYVFVDTNNDGNYNAGADMVLKLVGLANISVSDLVFG